MEPLMQGGEYENKYVENGDSECGECGGFINVDANMAEGGVDGTCANCGLRYHLEPTEWYCTYVKKIGE